MSVKEINQMDQLRKRWSLNAVTQIVFALNEGRDIHPILDQVITGHDPSLDEGVLDLRGIDFSHQNLRGPWRKFGDKRRRVGVKLRNADLTGSNMQWAILPWADLSGAILHSVDLRNAELIYANLSNADLTDVDLRGAWLCKTKFSEASVSDDQLKSRRNLGQLDFDYYAYTFK